MRLRCGKNCGSGGVPGHELADDGAVAARCRAPAARARADTRRRRREPSTATVDAAGRQRAAMRRRVDAARQTADDRRGRAPRDPRPAARRPTSAYGDAAREPTIATAGAIERRARPAHPEHRRRIGDRRQRGGIRGVAPGDRRRGRARRARDRWPRARARRSVDAIVRVAPAGARPAVGRGRAGSVAARAAARRRRATTRTAGGTARRSRARSVMAAPPQAARPADKKAGTRR